jgi:hypothetical protein
MNHYRQSSSYITMGRREEEVVQLFIHLDGITLVKAPSSIEDTRILTPWHGRPSSNDTDTFQNSLFAGWIDENSAQCNRKQSSCLTNMPCSPQVRGHKDHAAISYYGDSYYWLRSFSGSTLEFARGIIYNREFRFATRISTHLDWIKEMTNKYPWDYWSQFIEEILLRNIE